MSDNLEMRIKCLERQMREQRRKTQELEEWLDTVNSPWFKRIWWWLKGYRYHKLGRWYGNKAIPKNNQR